MTSIYRTTVFACLGAVCALGQRVCLEGRAMLTLEKGEIQVCGNLAAPPELQRQIDQLQKNATSNQEVLRELKHSITSMNALGRDIGQSKQVDLLKSFSNELATVLAASQAKSSVIMEALADKLDALQEKIAQSLSDPRTGAQTTSALAGRLGDAVADLDMNGVQRQLDSISAKLDKIDVNTAETNQNTRKMAAIMESNAAAEKAKADDERRKAAEMDRDPSMYTRAQIMPSVSPTGGYRVMIFFYSRPPLYPPFVDSSLSIAFRGGEKAWRVDASDKQVGAQGELWQLKLAENQVGDRAALCFVAHDKASGRLREWLQRYKVSKASSASSGLNFVPDGDSLMRLTDGTPCDGVTELRPEIAEKSVSQRLAEHNNELSDQIARQQASQTEMLAKRREETIAIMSARVAQVPFARVSMQGTRSAASGPWLISVKTSPLRGDALYDEKIQASLIDESGRATLLQLSNRQLFVNIETRTGSVANIGAKAMVCLIASIGNTPRQMIQWFSIETTRVAGGEKAAFLPSQPPTIADADTRTACQQGGK